MVERAENEIGRTIKVDKTILTSLREKFARVCVEVDQTGYKLKGRMLEIQCE